MEKVKIIALLLFLAVFIASLCLNVHHYTMREQEPYRDTIRTTFVDTIPYYKPVPKEEKPLGNITAKLPVGVPKLPENVLKLPENVLKLPENALKLQDSVQNFGKSVPEEHFEDMGEMVTPDSAYVVVPITQTVYEDSTYTAYVSGYRATLDSLIFRMPREITTITNTHYQKPKRWSVSIQVGYGMTLKGTPQFSPYVGIGVSYNLFSF